MQAIIDKAHQGREVDVTAAARGVWLVKVPKYLAEKWSKIEGTCDVGKLQITKSKVPNAKPEVMFSLNESFAESEAPDVPSTPRNHKFVLTGIAGQSLSVLSQSSGPESLMNPNTGQPMLDLLAIEGRVIQRAECRPVADARYMELKRVHVEMSNKPKREVEKLAGPVINYKPRYAHTHNLPDKGSRELNKRSRADKDKVMDMLFKAFEQHQYYNIKDLVRITDQPITYVKEILKEICIYNMKAPHKNMWEMKPEYRHYKTDS